MTDNLSAARLLEINIQDMSVRGKHFVGLPE